MFRKATAILVIFLMLFSLCPVGANATENVPEGREKTVKFIIGQERYEVGGKSVKTDIAPYIKDVGNGGGRIMVPVAFVAPALGTEPAIWLPTERAVQIKKGNTEIRIVIDSKELLVNGKPMQMDVAAEIQDVGNGGGRTMLPIAFIARALEVGYQWNGATSSVDFYGYNKSYSARGIYGPDFGSETIEGNVVVKADGVILQNMNIKGNLEIAKEVGDGDVTLNNITVQGETFIRGGGKDSIHINGGQYANVLIENVGNQVRVVATDVNGLQVVISENAAGEEVILEGSFANLTVNAPGTTVTLKEGTSIGQVTIEKNATNATVVVNTGAVVDKMIIDGEADIKGQGTVKEATINTDGITFEKAPEKQTIASTVETAPVVNPPASSGGGGGGGGDDTPTTIAVSAISVEPDVLLLTVDQTETIVATVKPANASNKRVTWSSSDPAVATVDANGKVTAVKGGTATITVTSVADSSKKATKQVLVGDKLVPAGGIIQEVIDEAEDEDVIAVAPSTYKEQLVINKSLTLLGPNAGIAGTGNRNAEAVITYPDEPKNNSGSSGDYAGLVLVEADDVVISGFTFDDGDKSVNSRLTRGINAHGSNIQITNNIVDGFNYVQILITSSFLDENNNWERYSEYCENAFVEGNYGKNALNFSSIYLQGAAGTVKNNTVENACRAIQIQPYGEQKGGIVENNELNGFRTGIYYNYANKGAGKWLIRDNDITATAVPEGFDQSGEWAGIEVQTFGTSGSGDAPKVSFEGNAVDGSGSNLETVGILMTTPIDDAAEATFTNNTFTGVNVGVDRQAGALMLGDVLENNVFPDGSIVIGDQIKVFVPKEEKVYNKNTGAEFDTIQDAVNAANEDDTILVGPGTFEIDNTLNITVPLTIKGMGPEKTIIDVTKVTDEHNCWGVLVGKSNTVLCDLAIVSTEGRAKCNNLKVSGEFAASVEHLDSIAIENVVIEGGKGLDIFNADATLDSVTVKESKGASIAVSNGSKVTISNCTTADGDWGSVGVMYKDGYSESIVTVGDGNEFGEGLLYCEGYEAESKNEIDGLGVEWFSYVNVEKDQLLWVKELSKGAFIEAESGPNHWYATIQSAVDAAVDGDTINILGDCTLIGATANNKNLTFIGNNSKPKVTFPQKGYQTYYGCEFTFENLTLECAPDENYQGIQPDKLIAKNCVINGKFWGYAKDLEFTDCVFNQNSSYNIWTYGSNVTFDNCEFNSAGRSVLIYNEGATLAVPAEIVFKNCTFSASTPVDKKAAIDIDTRFGSFNIEIENCSASGFSEVTESGGETIIPGFIHLKATDKGTLTVTVDGMQVYQLVPVTEVSLDRTEIILVADEIETLTATVGPANATNKEVTWTSSDDTVATVDEKCLNIYKTVIDHGT